MRVGTSNNNNNRIRDEDETLLLSSGWSRRWTTIITRLVTLLLITSFVVGFLDDTTVEEAPIRFNHKTIDYDQIIRHIALNPTTDFQYEDSYQNRAKSSILQDHRLLRKASLEAIQQRYAMFCIFHAANPEFIWLSVQNIPECLWEGVTCYRPPSSSFDDQNGRMDVVQKIQLQDTLMHGMIPPEVILLSHLQELDVKENPNLLWIAPELCQSQSQQEQQQQDGIHIHADCGTTACECCTDCISPTTRITK